MAYQDVRIRPTKRAVGHHGGALATIARSSRCNSLLVIGELYPPASGVQNTELHPSLEGLDKPAYCTQRGG
jgi:hypothetical protein